MLGNCCISLYLPCFDSHVRLPNFLSKKPLTKLAAVNETANRSEVSEGMKKPRWPTMHLTLKVISKKEGLASDTTETYQILVNETNIPKALMDEVIVTRVARRSVEFRSCWGALSACGDGHATATRPTPGGSSRGQTVAISNPQRLSQCLDDTATA